MKTSFGNLQYLRSLSSSTVEQSEPDTAVLVSNIAAQILSAKMTLSLSVSTIPIRVHTGPQRRGRKLSDRSRALVNAAVKDIQNRRRQGLSVSVREVAEHYKVPKSTLHRYLQTSISKTMEHESGRPRKLEISFMLSDWWKLLLMCNCLLWWYCESVELKLSKNECK